MYIKAKIWIIYAILVFLIIPWYWPKDISMLIYGMPIWVATSLFFTVVASIYTSYLLSKPWE